ncbi:MAG TPA: nickel pincer cofactor biosynthesis protein LarB [Haliangiales bacterium]|nr:nickel pincer cofactor biosynthesis protein LarB [Haliangiales bacterium]
MDPARLRSLLDEVAAGRTPVEAAVEELRALPFRELPGVATVDHHRGLRLGHPEVVYGGGKTADEIGAILLELAGRGHAALATRVDADKAARIVALVPAARYEARAQCVVVNEGPFEDRGRGTVAVVTAGTSDAPVAEEAAVTLRVFGNRVERVTDVGVAGVHRTLARVDTMRAAEVVIVIAGMEGALPSLVAGLVDRPVIAVPTSVGYGASYGGLAALLGMLNACAPGVTVVNIDNGFGAAYAASVMNRRRP